MNMKWSTIAPVEPPPEKRPRDGYDLKWVEQLTAEATLENNSMDLLSAIQENDQCLVFNMDLAFDSKRQQKIFERNPVAYLVKKLNISEEDLNRLSADELELFKRAKMKEVHSFIKNEAVRKCLDDKKVQEAYGSNRILKARRVLTWKGIAPDERDEALADRANNPKTVVNANATKKAKARIVLLGYQHPSLLDRGFKTSAPVQSSSGEKHALPPRHH